MVFYSEWIHKIFSHFYHIDFGLYFVIQMRKSSYSMVLFPHNFIMGQIKHFFQIHPLSWKYLHTKMDSLQLPGWMLPFYASLQQHQTWKFNFITNKGLSFTNVNQILAGQINKQQIFIPFLVSNFLRYAIDSQIIEHCKIWIWRHLI